MSGKQEQNGKANEYAIIISAHNLLQINGSNVCIEQNKVFDNAKRKFDLLPDYQKDDFLNSAKIGLNHIFELEPRMKNSKNELIKLSLQPDKKGSEGDVRDILFIRLSNYEIGISAKNNSIFIKSGRLSDRNDYFNKFGCSESNFFKLEKNKIFSLIDVKKIKNWSDFYEKEKNIYIPLLNSLVAEIKRKISDPLFAINFMDYFLGSSNDYYKLSNFKKETLVEALNFHNTLNKPFENINSITQIGTVEKPKEIIKIEFKTKDGQQNTIEILFDNGLKIFLRIHNGSSRTQKSLKVEAGILEFPNHYYKQGFKKIKVKKSK